MKDRVFQQDYVLPDEVSQEQIDLIKVGAVAIALVNPNFSKIVEDTQGLRARLHGECGLSLTQRMVPTALTDLQKRVEQLPAASVDRKAKTTCPMQVILYSIALSDPNVMQTQLDWLAKAIPRRFADDWVDPGTADDPAFLARVRDYAALVSRADRLKSKGITLDASITGPLESGPYVERVTAVAAPPVRARLDAQLTALEEEAPALWKRREAEAAEKRMAEEQKAYIAQLIANADHDVRQAEETLAKARAI